MEPRLTPIKDKVSDPMIKMGVAGIDRNTGYDITSITGEMDNHSDRKPSIPPRDNRM
jgi:hypothetical protein